MTKSSNNFAAMDMPGKSTVIAPADPQARQAARHRGRIG